MGVDELQVSAAAAAAAAAAEAHDRWLCNASTPEAK